MKTEIIYIFASVIIVSIASLIGIAGFLFSKKNFEKYLLLLVSFAAGALLGDVFIHLLPELSDSYGFGVTTAMYILLGILGFFVLEKFIHWRHCHTTDNCDVHGKHPHSLAIMNLVGDAFHNFIDGMIIAASYLLSIPIGVATTIAVLLHELPQEIGDFGVLLHSGLSKYKALALNFASAMIALIGAATAILLASHIENINAIIIPLAAGGFIYIAGTDLIPELHKQNTTAMSILQLVGIILGIGVMFALLIIG